LTAHEWVDRIVCGLVDRLALANLVKLKPGQHVILVQSIGYRDGIH
jgi:hypothetical protein